VLLPGSAPTPGASGLVLEACVCDKTPVRPVRVSGDGGLIMDGVMADAEEPFARLN
jgi:hypothetical protein